MHPYSPPTSALSGPSFRANTLSAPLLILVFATAATGLLLVSTQLLQRCGKGSRYKISLVDRMLVWWFVLTGLSALTASLAAAGIHCLFELYFLLHHHHLASRNDLLAQLWKEYALSDSRYLLSDPFLLAVESCTVLIIGPLALLTAVAIVRGSPWRHNLQALVSIMHLYGNMLYFATSLVTEQLHGIRYYRPEPMYYWLYFVGMNGIWIVIPAFCLYRSWKFSVMALSMYDAKKSQ